MRGSARLVSQERLVTDAEVPQEIVHRDDPIELPDAIQLGFDVLLGAIDVVVGQGPC